MPRPSPPPWAPTRLPPPSRRQCSSSFQRPTHSHAHRCSRLTRQHGGQPSGLVTLTFDLLTLKVVSESRVTWATSVPIFVFLGLSVLDLGPMYATDRRQTSDRRQTKASLKLLPPISCFCLIIFLRGEWATPPHGYWLRPVSNDYRIWYSSPSQAFVVMQLDAKFLQLHQCSGPSKIPEPHREPDLHRNLTLCCR